MANIEDISSVGDLRSAVFSNLFYGVLDSEDKERIANEIALRIDSKYVRTERRKTAGVQEELLKLREELEKKRIKRKKRERELEDDDWSLTEVDDLLEDTLRMDHRFYITRYSSSITKEDDLNTRIEKLKHAAAAQDVANVQFSRVVDDLLCEHSDDKRDIVDWVVYSKEVYNGVLAEVGSRINGNVVTPTKKYLDALLLLPKLEDDQDIIVFFGNNFHTTFASIDAYSGLLFAYEYFEYVGMT